MDCIRRQLSISQTTTRTFGHCKEGVAWHDRVPQTFQHPDFSINRFRSTAARKFCLQRKPKLMRRLLPDDVQLHSSFRIAKMFQSCFGVPTWQQTRKPSKLSASKHLYLSCKPARRGCCLKKCCYVLRRMGGFHLWSQWRSRQDDEMDAMQWSDASNDWEQMASSNSISTAFLAAWSIYRSMLVCATARTTPCAPRKQKMQWRKQTRKHYHTTQGCLFMFW